MARMGNWRDNKDVEIPLDGIGGVNIVVKADVHRSGTYNPATNAYSSADIAKRCQLPMLRLRKPSRNRRLREDGKTCRLRRLRPAELCRLAHRHGREARKRIMKKTYCLISTNDCIFLVCLISHVFFPLSWRDCVRLGLFACRGALVGVVLECGRSCRRRVVSNNNLECCGILACEDERDVDRGGAMFIA